MAIYFYSKIEEHGWLSNFSPHGFEEDGKWWPTVEHYFQAQKFPGAAYQDVIRRASSPKQAKSLGRTRKETLRPDWDAARDEVMRHAVRRKFETHRELWELLLATGDEELVENAPGDYYWGCGKTGTGQNRLGQILMEVRQALRERGGDAP